MRGAGRLRVDRRPVWGSSNEAHRGELAGDEAMEGDDRALTEEVGGGVKRWGEGGRVVNECSEQKDV